MRDSTGLMGVHHKECCGRIDAWEPEDTNMNKSYPKDAACAMIRGNQRRWMEEDERNRSKEARNGNQFVVSQSSVGLSRMD
jgi:hypothetical protein